MGQIELVECLPQPVDLLHEVQKGLSAARKTLPPKLFYDSRGSALFEKITALPEYYLTRTEIVILRERAGEIAGALGSSPVLIELGSGSSTKVRILLDAISGPVTYLAVDIAADQLRASLTALAADYPHARVIGLCADYMSGFALPPLPDQGLRTIFFPGSNLGNLDPAEARQFFGMIASMLRPGDGMLLGVDLKKDPALLHAAYNDRRGVTAEFNLNLLRRLNRELQAGFDLGAFEHLAFYNQDEGRIEMHLRSLSDQTISVGGKSFHFAAGETIHTENSYKYSQEDLEGLIAGSFQIERSWTDRRRWFGVHLLRILNR